MLRCLAAITTVMLLAVGAGVGTAAAPGPSGWASPKTIRCYWKAELIKQAKAAPHERFRNLTRSEFRARLRSASKRYGFRVLELVFLRPLQDAPLVSIETRHPLALSTAIPAIAQSLDPTYGEARNRHTYEGFYLDARTPNGHPFLVIYNNMRGETTGGQWASKEKFYPFLHG